MEIPLPKLRELKEAVVAIIHGPYTDKFPAEPARVAAHFRGFPDYFLEDCMGCGACASVCPPRAIKMFDDPQTLKRTLVIYIDRCITCGECQRNCPTKKGIRQTREYDMTTHERGELRLRKSVKELVKCESCDEIIGAKEHIIWTARKIGPLAFSNPTLMLTSLEAAGIPAGVSEGDFEKGLTRGDKVRILCPRCKQEAAFQA